MQDLDPAVVEEVRDILAKMLAGEFTRFDVFTGPINDNQGNVVLPGRETGTGRPGCIPRIWSGMQDIV